MATVFKRITQQRWKKICCSSGFWGSVCTYWMSKVLMMSRSFSGRSSYEKLREITSGLFSPLTNLLLNYFISRVVLEKPVKKFPAFYRNWRLITACARDHHLSLSRARSILSMFPSYFLKFHLNIILPSARKSFKQLFPHVSPPKTCTHLPSLNAYYMPLNAVTKHNILLRRSSIWFANTLQLVRLWFED